MVHARVEATPVRVKSTNRVIIVGVKPLIADGDDDPAASSHRR